GTGPGRARQLEGVEEPRELRGRLLRLPRRRLQVVEPVAHDVDAVDGVGLELRVVDDDLGAEVVAEFDVLLVLEAGLELQGAGAVIDARLVAGERRVLGEIDVGNLEGQAAFRPGRENLTGAERGLAVRRLWLGRET